MLGPKSGSKIIISLPMTFFNSFSVRHISCFIAFLIALVSLASCVPLKKYRALESNYISLQERETNLEMKYSSEITKCNKKVKQLSQQVDSLLNLSIDTVFLEVSDNELQKRYLELSVKYDYLKNTVKKAREVLCKCDADCEDKEETK
jgi:hypothetical protein